MASSRLYREARLKFVHDAEARYQDSKDINLLREFLAQNGRPEDAQTAAAILGQKVAEKWGTKRIGSAEIPAEWIDTLRANIGTFVAVGNYAMTGAPESVGLAWFAVKLTLSAIQSNYDLYTLFGSALTDISELMIIIPHYDRLYDERSKASAKNEWKPSPVVEKLFEDIIHAYAAVLSFSFSIQRHVRPGTLAKLRHGIKDFFGASLAKFEGKMADIASWKKKILEDSQAIFQDKSLHELDAVRDIVSGIEATVNQIRSFQSTLGKMHEEQALQWTYVLKSMEDIKSTTKPKTPWDLALQSFEKNREALNPQKNTSDALGDAIDQRHPGTCQWIFKCTGYDEWCMSSDNCMLCISGQQDSGKTTVLATVVETLDLQNSGNTVLLYMSCVSSRGSASGKKLGAETVCNTLLYLLYERASRDENQLKLLEVCNKVFALSRKEDDRIKAITKSNKAVTLPEFVDAFLAIASQLQSNIIVALDEADGLDAEDQRELAKKIEGVLASPKGTMHDPRSVKFLIGCRSISKFYSQVQDMTGLSWSIDVGIFNDNDMKKQLLDALKAIPGLTEAEQKEATYAILKKAGPRFAYIGTIAIPFMREPFRRPLSSRLQELPEGMNSIYNEALRKMGSNYAELLRTALVWSLLAPVPLRDHEIMDMYHGTYFRHGLEVEEEAKGLIERTFLRSSKLEIEQLQDARGPFLRLDLEPWSGYYIVNLEDPPQIREFCLSEKEKQSRESDNEAHICTRCMAATSETHALTISPRDGHLKLALDCMRTMNNAVFQRRATYMDITPLWCQDATSSDVPNVELPSQNDHNVVSTNENATDTAFAEGGESTLDDHSTGEQLGGELATSNRVGSHEGISSDMVLDNDDHSVIIPDAIDLDDSQDDEDRGEIDLINRDEKVDYATDTQSLEYRMSRYETLYWSYHIQQAEALWSPEERSKSNRWTELLGELTQWVTKNKNWFSRWQLEQPSLSRHEGRLKPLHVAAYFGLTSWASHLLESGADIDEAPEGGDDSPLQVAADKENSIEMLQLLLENDANPNMARGRSTPAFQKWMLNRSDLSDIELLLKHGANPTQIDQADSWTALHCFAWTGEDPRVLEMLLNHTVDGVKPDINARDWRGNTPIHFLLLRRDVPKILLKAFLLHGADINNENNHSARPLHMACQYGDLEILKILHESKSITDIDDEDDRGSTALHEAAVYGHSKCVELLCNANANTDIQTIKYGRAALHDVAWMGNKECVEILLKHGADPNILDKHNRTPLFFACLDVVNEEKAELLLDTLLEQNVPLSEINKLTKRGRTPLREAAAHGFEHVVEKLIKTADSSNDSASLALDTRDTRRGMTPLHRAAWLGKAGCVRLLLEANANVTIRDNSSEYGKTALILAYEHWAGASHQGAFEDIVSRLVDKDPDAAVADPELAAVCAINGSTQLLQQLSTMGADFSRQDQYGWTPMELARHHRQEHASHFLRQQAAWAGTLPSQWAANKLTNISQDGTTVTHTSGQRVCLSTTKPLPPGLDNFYFEITSKAKARDNSGASETSKEVYPIVGIGFCTIGGSAILFPGWPPRGAAPSARSWGYHGDDGALFDSGSDIQPVAVELPYHAGDTVGCGVDLATQKMWFTQNGHKLDSEFGNVKGRLFPLLGLRDEVEIEANFTGPFLWKDSGGEEDEVNNEIVKVGAAA
ncbi:protein SSH4 [Parastagonospora nodorum]|nr:protein SSH4 [Parastagonospora nodorum]